MSHNPIRFPDGARWVRADFHLHTDADKEFEHGCPDTYFSDYANGLRDAKIEIGAITNHNKFDFEEFKNLRKAVKSQTMLLPGVELSTNEGANGVHLLIVFGDVWLRDDQDRISPFISSMFPGKSAREYQYENGRSDKGLLAVIDELEKCHLSYFVVFAHVEQRSGLWAELKGGKLGDFKDDRYTTLKERTLGFQKVMTDDAHAAGRPKDLGRVQVKSHLESWYPAEVEGSDCKRVSEIGKGSPCYLKVGELSYAAVEFALHDFGQRVTTGEKPSLQSPPFLREIRFKGGRLAGEIYPLNSQLSCLIGSRGSGKSSVIETLRFALAIETGRNDASYKNGLVEAVLGNGGEIIVSVTGGDGSSFEIQRTLGYASRVFLEGAETKLNPSDIIPNLLYFGQKDLGNRHEDFEAQVFSQLIGRQAFTELEEKERQMEGDVRKLVEHWKAIRIGLTKETSYRDEADHLRDTLEIYKKHGIETQLEQLTQFDTDKRNLDELILNLEEQHASLTEFPDAWEEIAGNWPALKSVSLLRLDDNLSTIRDQLIRAKESLQALVTDYRVVLDELKQTREELRKIENQQQEQFTELQREAKAPDGLNLQTFRKQKYRLAQLEKLLRMSKNTSTAEIDALHSATTAALQLHDYRRSVHRSEVDVLADKAANLPSDLELKVKYEADREAFRDFLGGLVSGQGVRRKTLDMLVRDFKNGLVIFQKREEVFGKLEGSADKEKIKEMVIKHLADLLCFKVPEQREIRFKKTPIQELSMGQRATALLQLLMSVEDHPLFIIDQPEDDLDNETIFGNVVKPLLKKKNRAQFLIATHNPNIPVLGDAELVHACRSREHPQGGSLDSSITRDAIVSIMEGGKQAFERRQQVYKQWTNTL